MLDLRSISKEEYQKRIDGYYQSEEILKNSKQLFDLVLINNYDEKSIKDFINVDFPVLTGPTTPI